MRIFAIGDIHGCSSALRALVKLVGIGEEDLLITLGDYVDKGPDTPGVLDWLCARQRHNPESLIALRGNHDQMMLDARHNHAAFKDWWYSNGDKTLDAYPPSRDGDPLSSVPQRHWDFLEDTRLYYDTPTHFYVHGNVNHELPLSKQSTDSLLWDKFYDPDPHVSGKTMVAGHTSQKSGEVLDLGHAVCIDTWACGQGWLTCLEPETGRIWQANQTGKTRITERV
ncbi:metallophosphoesterase family protein [Algisphaera agarilytica]|uniref:Serine/threonine protein phosphatase 1 n=1 Tax=Algisphaera agarilytica TaxID=1385975 RepID=A0A7X0H5M2_9BACT|nr:metallophosphoesterase family protein [Algisphaera agarilytica]MBB6429679.1 serine/threonine protein phosphatase 1 [Algisphaera agarilytica]